MHLIKQLYKIEIEPVCNVNSIRRSLGICLLVATAVSYWRGTPVPALIALAASVFGFVYPVRMGFVLTWIKTFMAAFIHTINLILLTVVYFVVVTPLGIALKCFQGKDEEWRREPTEIPSRETFLRPY